MPSPEASHTGVRPPEHVVHPLDPRSKEAGILRAVGDQFKKESQNFFEKNPADKLRKYADEAGEYALDLMGYWSRGLNFATDSYIYGGRGDKNQLVKLTAPLKEIGRKLESQLKTWEEVTSPYADSYDEGKIYDTARELLGTITRALTIAKPDIPGDEQENEESSFNSLISSFLTGLSGEIGKRLGQLGAGRAVEPVTMSSQTREVIERAGKDSALEPIAGNAKEARDFRDDFLKNDSKAKRLELQDIREKLRNPALSGKERGILAEERMKAKKILEKIERAIDKELENHLWRRGRYRTLGMP
jgi:hypothetical protein